VPVVFSLVDGVKTRLERRLGRMFQGQRDADGPVSQPTE